MASPKDAIKYVCNLAEWLDSHKAYGWGLLLIIILLFGGIGYSQHTFEEENTNKIETFGCSLEEMSQDLKSLKSDNDIFTQEVMKFDNRVNVIEGKLDLLIEMSRK